MRSAEVPAGHASCQKLGAVDIMFPLQACGILHSKCIRVLPQKPPWVRSYLKQGALGLCPNCVLPLPHIVQHQILKRHLLSSEIY